MSCNYMYIYVLWLVKGKTSFILIFWLDQEIEPFNKMPHAKKTKKKVLCFFHENEVSPCYGLPLHEKLLADVMLPFEETKG